MYKSRRRTLKFASVIENINIVERFVDEICDEYHINNTFFGNIIVSVTEAVKNAIIFGNGSNPNKNVIVKFEPNPAMLSFTVIDEGKGFDYNDISDPTKETDPLNTPLTPLKRGISQEGSYGKQKGLYLIKKLSDKVKFYNHGSQIEMIFQISSINRELAVERVNKINNYFKLVVYSN